MKDYPHWRKEDFEILATTHTYKDMARVALRILERIPGPVVQVCGPLTTGGRGSLEENLKMFDQGVQLLVAQGKNVFDQRPFEEPMQRLKILLPKGEYAVEILDDFYLPVFESGLIHELHFLPGWQESRGARWEYEQAQRLGISIHHLPEELSLLSSRF